MTVDELRKMLRAQPFRPFEIHLADGRSLPVNHPEVVAIVPQVTSFDFLYQGL